MEQGVGTTAFQVTPMTRDAVLFVQLRAHGTSREGCALYRFQIFHKIIHPHISAVYVLLNLMKDWSPNRHQSRSVGWHRDVACNSVSHISRRKMPPIILRQHSQIRDVYFHGGCRGSVAFRIHAVA